MEAYFAEEKLLPFFHGDVVPGRGSLARVFFKIQILKEVLLNNETYFSY